MQYDRHRNGRVQYLPPWPMPELQEAVWPWHYWQQVRRIGF